MMRSRVKSFLCILAASFLFFICTAYYVFLYFPYAPLNKKIDYIVFNVPMGANVKTMLRQLQRRGVLNSFQAQAYQYWIRSQNAEKLLKAGEYAFPTNITPQALLKKMIKGEVVQYVLTFPEGGTFTQLLQILSTHPSLKKTLGSQSPTEIMALLGEPTLWPEGLFFPETYYFTAGMTDLDLLRRARKVMQEKLTVAWERRDQQVGLQTPYEALILASIIEKETALSEERFLISGVFHRRLEKKMRLQADPTVIYGVRDAFQNRLTREQLKQDTPYNTYLHKGLPPTPIALPSWKAIEAALHPAPGASLYFVAKPDGSHQFSATLQEHNEAVNKYQRGSKNDG